MHKANVPQAWRRFENRYRLVGVHCKSCNSDYYPPRAICPKCRRHGDLEEKEFAQEGIVLSYSVIYSAPENMEIQTPYTIALIKLKDGPVISAQIVDSEKIEIGQKVTGCFRKMYEDGKEGIIFYGVKFKPLRS